LQQNEICNFIGLPELPMLTRLDLDGNLINSFQGCRQLPNLRFLSLRNNPISRNKYLKLMALVAFGGQLLKMNNEPIPPDIREDAAILEEALFPLLSEGKILTNLKPLRVADTRQQSYCAPDQSLIAASRFIGYTTPLVDKQNQAWSRRLLGASPPSVIGAWHHIVVNKLVPCLPQDFTNHVYQQLLDLRGQLVQSMPEGPERVETEQDGNQNIALKCAVDAQEIFASDSSEVAGLLEEQIPPIDGQEGTDDKEEEEQEEEGEGEEEVGQGGEKVPTEPVVKNGEPTEEEELGDDDEEEDIVSGEDGGNAEESGNVGDTPNPADGDLSE
jgi:hypothetical protein